MLTGSRSAPAGLVQHSRAEDLIDAGLISLPLGFKPRKDIGINSECQRLFNRAIEFPNYRAVPVAHFREIGQVNVVLFHFLQVSEFLCLLSTDFRNYGNVCWWAPICYILASQ